MSDKWNDDQFKSWQNSRKKFNENKKLKRWHDVIDNCSDIIVLESKAKFIGIVTPIFYKEIANAYEKLGDKLNAVKNYRLAKDAFVSYRSTAKLNSPSDWLSDIEKIDKKIEKLSP